MALNTTSDRYTDARRTRVYHREEPAPSVEERMGQTQAIQMEGKLFDGLSVPQIIAGAAAAATSVALASHIGIAGSVIGAAVSSVITVVSSQVYRRFLTSGAQRIKRAARSNGGASYAPDYGYGTYAGQSAAAQPARYGARVAPTKLQARASAQREATQRKVIGFSVLAGALAVVVCAGAIWLFTAGQGLGQRIDTLWPAANEQAADTTPRGDAQTSAGNDGKSASASDSAPSSTDSGGAGNTSTGGDGTSSDTAQGGTSTDDTASGGNGTQDTSNSQGKTDDTQADSSDSAAQSANAA